MGEATNDMMVMGGAVQTSRKEPPAQNFNMMVIE